jgi:hypothetical protein
MHAWFPHICAEVYPALRSEIANFGTRKRGFCIEKPAATAYLTEQEML